MSDTDILNEMIKDSARVELSEHYGRRQVSLSEPQQNQCSTTICDLPENAVVIRVDAFRSPDAIFGGSHGECKRADYAILSSADDKKVIIYIEMKTTRGTEKEIIQQLKGAQCFISYCREIGKSFWNEPDFLEGYRARFVLINHTSIPKRRTRLTRHAGCHDQPERMMKIHTPHRLQFNQLAGH